MSSIELLKAHFDGDDCGAGQKSLRKCLILPILRHHELAAMLKMQPCVVFKIKKQEATIPQQKNTFLRKINDEQDFFCE